ncbi:hypothetical protein CFP66_03285 [Pseudonocardia sp. MH-G8]|nr:hypothetical protein CFP66_03285 [Pseudonocardia sp. MH-G8]
MVLARRHRRGHGGGGDHLRHRGGRPHRARERGRTAVPGAQREERRRGGAQALGAEEQVTGDDHAHMRKVVGYVHRHLAQRPTKESIEDSRWRHSLMNWGHDPCKG